jgi:hemolysin-activating ACP:hemolysin acyltransferase
MKADPKAVLDMLYILSNSPLGKDFAVNNFCSDFINPLVADKVYIDYSQGLPSGMATWCFLSNQQAEKYVNGEYSPTAEDYQRTSGDQLWGMWFVSLTGEARRLYKLTTKQLLDKHGPQEILWLRTKDSSPKTHRGKTNG